MGREEKGFQFSVFFLVNFCCLLCTAYFIANICEKNSFFVLMCKYFLKKMAQIFADVFRTANITVKTCDFLCTAYIFANICAKNNGIADIFAMTNDI